MPKSSTWVVKLGGAMLCAEELPQWLEVCQRAAQQRRVVIVAGGGGLADEVRRLQQRWQFDDELAHTLAIATMGMNAQVLCALLPAARALRSLGPGAGDGGVGCEVWLAEPCATQLALPASWAVSADSIAIRIAELISAARVFLVKSLPRAELGDASASALCARGVLDPYVPQLLRRLNFPLTVVSKFDAAAFGAHSGGGAPCGSRLQP